MTEEPISFSKFIGLMLATLAVVVSLTAIIIILFKVSGDPEAVYTSYEPVQFTGTFVLPDQSFICKDGSVSIAKHRIGACQGHGGAFPSK